MKSWLLVCITDVLSLTKRLEVSCESYDKAEFNVIPPTQDRVIIRKSDHLALAKGSGERRSI